MQTYSVTRALIFHPDSIHYTYPDPDLGSVFWFIPLDIEKTRRPGVLRDEKHHAINRCTHVTYSPFSDGQRLYMPFRFKRNKSEYCTACSSFRYWEGHTGSIPAMPDTWMASRVHYGTWAGHYGYATVPSWKLGDITLRFSCTTDICQYGGSWRNALSFTWDIDLKNSVYPPKRDTATVTVSCSDKTAREKFPNVETYLGMLKELILEFYFSSLGDDGYLDVSTYVGKLDSNMGDFIRKFTDNFEFDNNCLNPKLKGNSDQWGTREVISDIAPDISGIFLFNEPERIWDRLSPLMFERGTLSNYWYNWLVQHAFLNACETVPRLNDNMISNVLEIFDFVRDLKHGKVTMPHSLSDAWLAYRYSVGTTALDIQEAYSFVVRNMDVPNHGVWKGYGIARHAYRDVDVTVRCVLYVSPNNYNSLSTAWRDISQLGFAPDLYQIWDSLPFSFIADWFIPIGDVLNATDQAAILTEENYSFSDICYTITYKIGNKKCFSRWSEKHPPQLNGFYWFDKESDPSLKTTVFRCIDAAALIQGTIRR